jgi:hypothetical protein
MHKYLYASADPVDRIDFSGKVNLIGNAATASVILGSAREYLRTSPVEDEALITAGTYAVPRAHYLYRWFSLGHSRFDRSQRLGL